MRREGSIDLNVAVDDVRVGQEVAHILPSLAADARSAIGRIIHRGHGVAMNPMCPACGGPKTNTALRCARCRLSLAASLRASAEKAGARRVSRRLNDIPVVPFASPPPRLDSLNTSSRVKGEGDRRKQPAWSRKILVDGVWVNAE